MISDKELAAKEAMKELVRDLIKGELRVDIKVEDCDTSMHSHWVTVSLYLGEECEPFHTSSNWF